MKLSSYLHTVVGFWFSLPNSFLSPLFVSLLPTSIHLFICHSFIPFATLDFIHLHIASLYCLICLLFSFLTAPSSSPSLSLFHCLFHSPHTDISFSFNPPPYSSLSLPFTLPPIAGISLRLSSTLPTIPALLLSPNTVSSLYLTYSSLYVTHFTTIPALPPSFTHPLILTLPQTSSHPLLRNVLWNSWAYEL